jgi:hypothetical protein
MTFVIDGRAQTTHISHGHILRNADVRLVVGSAFEQPGAGIVVLRLESPVPRLVPGAFSVRAVIRFHRSLCIFQMALR